MPTLADYLRRCERDYLVRALERHGWQISDTAAELRISRKNLWERIVCTSLRRRKTSDARARP